MHFAEELRTAYIGSVADQQRSTPARWVAGVKQLRRQRFCLRATCTSRALTWCRDVCNLQHPGSAREPPYADSGLRLQAAARGAPSANFQIAPQAAAERHFTMCTAALV